MSNKEKFRRAIPFIVLIVVIVAIILGFYLFNNQNKNEKTVTTLGRIELIVVDENNNPVDGSVFSLIDTYGNSLMEVQTHSDGVVDFYSVPVGNYTIKQISAPEGYEIKENSKTVTVIGGELTTVKFEN